MRWAGSQRVQMAAFTWLAKFWYGQRRQRRKEVGTLLHSASESKEVSDSSNTFSDCHTLVYCPHSLSARLRVTTFSPHSCRCQPLFCCPCKTAVSSAHLCHNHRHAWTSPHQEVTTILALLHAGDSGHYAVHLSLRGNQPPTNQFVLCVITH